jgi:hypothetical protein
VRFTARRSDRAANLWPLGAALVRSLRTPGLATGIPWMTCGRRAANGVTNASQQQSQNAPGRWIQRPSRVSAR